MRRKELASYVLVLAASACSTGTSTSGGNTTEGDNKQLQICTLASGGVGTPASVVCKNIWTGALIQTVETGVASAGPGGVGGVLAQHRNQVLVTGLVGTAMLFTVTNGLLGDPVSLDVGEDSLSGTLTSQGAYVLTGKNLYFFPNGETTRTSHKGLQMADGSAAQVVVTGGFAYVSEKSGSLEAFELGALGNVIGLATPVSGVPAGAIVGIASLNGLVVAPVAHLASAPGGNGSAIPVVNGLKAGVVLSTRELAACWADGDDGEVCITNPGTMTISCGQFDNRGFTSFTSIANTAPLVGDTLLDIAVNGSIVGVLGKADGKPAEFIFEREGDFVKQINQLHQFPVGFADVANGVMLLSDRDWSHIPDGGDSPH